MIRLPSVGLVLIILLGLSLFYNINLYQSVAEAINPFLKDNKQISAANSTTILSSNFTTYTNPLYGIKIDYPSSWRTYQLGEGNLYFSGGTGDSELGFFMDLDVKPSDTLDKLTRKYILDRNQFSFIKSLEVISINKTKISSGTVDANEVLYKYDSHILISNGTLITPTKHLAILALKDGIYYGLVYDATAEGFDIYLPVIKKMINSFEIIELTS